jgi:hypothetical protein
VTRPLRSLASGALLLVAVALAGCAGTVALEPAPAADDPACAAVTVLLPDTVAGEERRWTDAQSTGAWGSPSSVILTCGVTEPGPTTQRCELVEGVYWVIDETDAENDRYRFTTYGRSPAVEVYLDNATVGSADTLRALSPMLNTELGRNGRECLDRPGTEETPAA